MSPQSAKLRGAGLGGVEVGGAVPDLLDPDLDLDLTTTPSPPPETASDASTATLTCATCGKVSVSKAGAASHARAHAPPEVRAERAAAKAAAFSRKVAAKEAAAKAVEAALPQVAARLGVVDEIVKATEAKAKERAAPKSKRREKATTPTSPRAPRLSAALAAGFEKSVIEAWAATTGIEAGDRGRVAERLRAYAAEIEAGEV